MAGVVMLLAVLLAMVAAGIGGGHRRGEAPSASTVAVRAFLDVGLGAAGLVGLFVAGLVVNALRNRRRLGRPPEQRVYRPPPVPWALRLALVLVLLGVIGGVAAVLRGTNQPRTPTRPALPPPALPAERPTSNPKGSVRVDAPVVAGIMVLGVTAAAVLLMVPGRRRRQGGVAAARDSDPPAADLDVAADDLVADPNPRRAVIAAYARMERVLAAAGVARSPSDAPFEYLGRVREVLETAGPPARRLTELFERAKFSTAEIDTTMQADAVGALRALIHQMRGPS